MKTLRLGIEIETVGLSRTKLAEAIHSVVGGTISNDYRDVRITTASGRTWKVIAERLTERCERFIMDGKGYRDRRE